MRCEGITYEYQQPKSSSYRSKARPPKEIRCNNKAKIALLVPYHSAGNTTHIERNYCEACAEKRERELQRSRGANALRVKKVADA